MQMPARRLVFLLCLFAVGAALAFAGAVGLTWWVDPQHERYDPAILARADAEPTPCRMTTDAIGDSPAIAAFKLDVLRRQDPSTIVLGISRGLEIRSWPGEKGFANLGTPGLGPVDALAIVEHLHALHPGPVTAYVDVDPAWTNAGWSPFLGVGLTRLQRLRRYVSSAGLLESVRYLASHRSADPWRIAASERDGVCVLHPAGESAAPPLWYADGSIEWATARKHNAEAVGQAAGGVAGLSALDPARVAQIERLLARMHALGWRVVGFTPPIAPWAAAVLRTRPQDVRALTAYDAEMRRLLARNGAPYLDLLRFPQRVSCTDADFTSGDELHPGAACSARLRRVLDRMATGGASQAPQSTASGG
jgi:hypothetical protein